MDQHSFHEFCPQPETGGPYGRLEVVLLAERWRKASRRFAAEMSSLRQSKTLELEKDHELGSCSPDRAV